MYLKTENSLCYLLHTGKLDLKTVLRCSVLYQESGAVAMLWGEIIIL